VVTIAVEVTFDEDVKAFPFCAAFLACFLDVKD
jgi:hypothetical protein